MSTRNAVAIDTTFDGIVIAVGFSNTDQLVNAGNVITPGRFLNSAIAGVSLIDWCDDIDDPEDHWALYDLALANAEANNDGFVVWLHVSARSPEVTANTVDEHYQHLINVLERIRKDAGPDTIVYISAMGGYVDGTCSDCLLNSACERTTILVQRAVKDCIAVAGPMIPMATSDEVEPDGCHYTDAAAEFYAVDIVHFPFINMPV
jgi:hypothetical protein